MQVQTSIHSEGPSRTRVFQMNLDHGPVTAFHLATAIGQGIEHVAIIYTYGHVHAIPTSDGSLILDAEAAKPIRRLIERLQQFEAAEAHGVSFHSVMHDGEDFVADVVREAAAVLALSTAKGE